MVTWCSSCCVCHAWRWPVIRTSAAVRVVSRCSLAKPCRDCMHSMPIIIRMLQVYLHTCTLPSLPIIWERVDSYILDTSGQGLFLPMLLYIYPAFHEALVTLLSVDPLHWPPVFNNSCFTDNHFIITPRCVHLGQGLNLSKICLQR